MTAAGRFDWAVWDPIDGRNSLPNQVLRMVIHTAVTSSADIYGPGRGPDDTYAHFFNPLDKRIRQHQEIHHKAYADGHANGYSVAVEHQDNDREMPLSASQIDDDARLFAHLVTHHGLPNRIATVDNTHGLAWHRLGISGNFGAYNPHDRKTWSRAQTGQNWSDSYGKVCPWDPRIDQIDDIFNAAQKYISGDSGDDASTLGDDMPTYNHKWNTREFTVSADGEWHTINISDDDEGSKQNLISGHKATFGADLFVSLKQTGGREVDVRWVQVDTKSGASSKDGPTGPVVQHSTRAGWNQLGYHAAGQMVLPGGGYSRHLRFQVRGYTPGDAKPETMTINKVDARALVWE